MTEDLKTILLDFMYACLKDARNYWMKWKKFMRHSFVRILLIYAAISLVTVVAYIALDQWMAVSLDLRPAEMPEPSVDPPAEIFLFSLTILPVTLLLEDLGIRLMPWIFLKPLSSMDVEEKRAWRIWLFKHVFTIYIVVSALWHSLLHQVNIFDANPLGSLVYFGIQLVSGLMLAWIYKWYGFWQSYTIHLSWDVLLIAFLSLLTFVSSL